METTKDFGETLGRANGIYLGFLLGFAYRKYYTSSLKLRRLHFVSFGKSNRIAITVDPQEIFHVSTQTKLAANPGAIWPGLRYFRMIYLNVIRRQRWKRERERASSIVSSIKIARGRLRPIASTTTTTTTNYDDILASFISLNAPRNQPSNRCAPI